MIYQSSYLKKEAIKDAQHSQAAMLLAQGKTIEQTAQAVGCGTATISRWLRSGLSECVLQLKAEVQSRKTIGSAMRGMAGVIVEVATIAHNDSLTEVERLAMIKAYLNPDSLRGEIVLNHDYEVQIKNKTPKEGKQTK